MLMFERKKNKIRKMNTRCCFLLCVVVIRNDMIGTHKLLNDVYHCYLFSFVFFFGNVMLALLV